MLIQREERKSGNQELWTTQLSDCADFCIILAFISVSMDLVFLFGQVCVQIQRLEGKHGPGEPHSRGGLEPRGQIQSAFCHAKKTMAFEKGPWQGFAMVSGADDCFSAFRRRADVSAAPERNNTVGRAPCRARPSCTGLFQTFPLQGGVRAGLAWLNISPPSAAAWKLGSHEQV